MRQQQPTSNGIRWNGRQIRNAFQSALAIAEFTVNENTPAKLEINHFEKVAKASVEFEDYLWRVKSGRSDADIAAHNMMRADNYGADQNPSNTMHLAPRPSMGSQPAFKPRPKTPANMPYMPQNMQSMSHHTPAYQMSQQPQQGYQSSPPAMSPYQQPGSSPGSYMPSGIGMNMSGYDMGQGQGHAHQHQYMQQGRGPSANHGLHHHSGEGSQSPGMNQQQQQNSSQQHHPMQNKSSQQAPPQHSYSSDNYQYSQQNFQE